MTPEEFVKKLNDSLKAAGVEDRVSLVNKRERDTGAGFLYWWNSGYDGAMCYVVIGSSGRVTEYIGVYDDENPTTCFDRVTKSKSVDLLIARIVREEKSARGPLTGD